jgi:hypothetical protein
VNKLPPLRATKRGRLFCDYQASFSLKKSVSRWRVRPPLIQLLSGLGPSRRFPFSHPCSKRSRSLGSAGTHRAVGQPGQEVDGAPGLCLLAPAACCIAYTARRALPSAPLPKLIGRQSAPTKWRYGKAAPRSEPHHAKPAAVRNLKPMDFRPLPRWSFPLSPSKCQQRYAST